MARKTIQVNEDVHARFMQMWKKTPSYLDGYGDSASDVLLYLMDFYEKYRSEEVEIAINLIKKIKTRG